MPAPRSETVARLTDNVVDAVLSRLGNDGISLGDDFIARLNQIFGLPIEVTPASPASLILTVGPSAYALPDGQRVAVLDDGYLPTLATGTMNFGNGAISTGANPTFVLPAFTSGQFVRGLLQYKVDENKLNVSFGAQGASIAASGVPAILDGYSAAYIVELAVTGNAPGNFAVISKAALVRILGGFRSGKGILREKQDVVASSQSVFNLTTIVIPKNRQRLVVLQGGAALDPSDDYTVNSDTQVTLATAALNGARLTFIVI